MGAWWGPPKWNGKIVDPNWKKLFYPSLMGAPLVTLLEGTDDQFAPCFSSVEKLREYMEKLIAQLGEMNYDITTIAETEIGMFYEALKSCKIRIMIDPQIINPHHTKWVEIVEDGEQLKYFNAENN